MISILIIIIVINQQLKLLAMFSSNDNHLCEN